MHMLDMLLYLFPIMINNVINTPSMITAKSTWLKCWVNTSWGRSSR